MSLKPAKLAESVTPTRRGQRLPVCEMGKPADLSRSIRTCWEELRGLAPSSSGSLVIALSEDFLQRMWMNHQVRWCYYYEPMRLEGLSRRLIRGHGLTPVELDYLKNLKNIGDDLRHFFQLFAVTHQVPKPIQSLVKMVGQLRDQVRLGELRRASKQARELLELLPKSGKIDWPKLRVDPVTRCGFLRERLARMEKLLARKTLTAFDFHQLKKDFRLVYSVYYYLYPEEARLPAGQNAFSGAKKIIKKMHQVLLEQKYRNDLKYRSTPVSLPEEFRLYLLRFLGTIKITARRGGRGIKIKLRCEH